MTFAQDWPNLGRFREANAALAPPAAGETRVVFMGNSITEGWSEHRPSFFEGKPYINRGISGQTTPQMLLRFRQDVIDLQPQAVVILAGINDIAGNTGPATLESIYGNLVSMVQLAQAAGIKVVLCSVLPASSFPWAPGIAPAEQVVALNQRLQAFAEAEGLVYVDYFAAMVDEATLGLRDGLGYDPVHPNEAGYQVMEPLVEAGIRQALGQ